MINLSGFRPVQSGSRSDGASASAGEAFAGIFDRARDEQTLAGDNLADQRAAERNHSLEKEAQAKEARSVAKANKQATDNTDPDDRSSVADGIAATGATARVEVGATYRVWGGDSEDLESEVLSDPVTARWQLVPKDAKTSGEEGEAEADGNGQDGTSFGEESTDIGLITPAGASRQAAGALELLSPSEMMDPDLVIDNRPDQILMRIQQAASQSSTPALEELADAVFPQVVRGLAALIRDGGAEVRLQLQPVDLGHIEMRVRTIDGVVAGQLMVQNLEIKHLLDSQMERLREALQEQGLELAGFDVDVEKHESFARQNGGFDVDRRSVGARQSAEALDTELTLVPRDPVRLEGSDRDWDYIV